MLDQYTSSVAFLHSFPVYWALLIAFIGLVGGVRIASDSIEKATPYPALRTAGALILMVPLTKMAMDWTALCASLPSDLVQTANHPGAAIGFLIICQLLCAMLCGVTGFTAGYGARLFGHIGRKREKESKDSKDQ